VSVSPYASLPAEHPVDDRAPALWDPEVAADWSLLLSPAFGAALQMRNWQHLGRPEEAAASRNWVIGSLVFCLLAIVLSVQMGVNGAEMSCSLYLILLMVWYLNSGKAQARYVRDHFGADYRRRSWGKPIALVVGLLGYMLVCLAIGWLLASLRVVD
jgi:lysylphosphatidylglycerol synthetase-like protein (DUF2156 family)